MSGGLPDGLRGDFEIEETDKTGRDFRSKGMLRYVGKHYLQFAGSGEFFLKAGADAPENLLAYADFDGTFHQDGYKDHFVKKWEPHVRDWKIGDPSWQNGKGKGLIGAVNYLASKGMNAFSFLTLNIAGDDQNVFPYVDYKVWDRMDVSKLDQWEMLFEHADKLGMFLHFKTSEMENQGLLDNGDLGLQRKLYYRELIARFGHHLAMNWNIGEENGLWVDNHPTPWQTTTQRLACAQYFYDHDPYRHHIVIHNGQQFYDLLGPESRYTGPSIQTHRRDYADVHRDVLLWRNLSAQLGKRWACALDEPGDHRYALEPDAVDAQHNRDRQYALWGAFMAGAWGIEWYFGYENVHSDLTCEDWRSRENMWDQSRYLLDFFHKNDIPFWNMDPDDDWTADPDDYVLRQGDRIAVIYLKSGRKQEVLLKGLKGTYSSSWYNPRTGAFAGAAKMHQAEGDLNAGPAPGDADQDWVLLIKKQAISLFNGKNLDGWRLYVRDLPIGKDPKKVFQVNKAGEIHISGEAFGYLMTESIFQDFHFSLDFKWGEKKWAPRLDKPRDSGILYSIPDGAADKIWPKSLECQIQEGDVGDFWLIDSTTIVIDGRRTEPARFQRAAKKLNAENPHGAWNHVEVTCIDGHCVHTVNGIVVNEGYQASEQKGRILIQSEGAEIFYKNIQVTDIRN